MASGSTASLWAESIAATKALVTVEAQTVFSDFFNRWVRVLRVGKTITADYQTISDALSHSKPYDRIEIETGNYYETISISHSVELTASDRGDDAVISTRGPCITIATDDPVLICRLTIVGRGQRAADCEALHITRGSPTVRDCTLSAVHVSASATPTITQCTIENSDAGAGLRLSDHCGGLYTHNDIRFHKNECVKIACSGRPVLRKNRIYQKRGTHATLVNIAAGRFGASCAPVFEENLVSGTEQFNAANHSEFQSQFERPTDLLQRNFSVPDGLIAVCWGASPTIVGNTLLGGVVGVHLAESYLPEGQFQKNRISGCSSWGVYLGRNAAVHLYDNEISHNAGGLRAQALDAIVEASTIHDNQFFGVMLYEAPTTIVKNHIFGSEVGVVMLKDCTGMTFEDNKIRHCLIAGMQFVKSAVCCVSNNIIMSNKSCGILVSDRSTVELCNNVCKENDTNILVRGQSHAHVHHNTLLSPVAHNIIVMEQSYGTIEHNDVSEAPTLAHIAVVEKSSPKIRHNFIRAGASAGILVESHATPEISGNQMTSLREGVRVRRRGDPLLIGNDIQSCVHGVLCEEDGTCVVVENSIKTCSYAFVTSRSGGFPTVRYNECRNSAKFGFSVEDGGRGEFEKNSVRECSVCSLCVRGPSSSAYIVRNRFLGGSGVTAGGGGISVERLGSAVVMQNTFSDMGKFALRSVDQGLPTVHKNVVYSCEGVGIVCIDAGGVFSENTIQGCKIAGIQVREGSSASFDRNLIRECDGDGILVAKSARSVFTNNVVESNAGSGVVVTGDADLTELRQTSIWKNGAHGVKVSSGGCCLIERSTISENQGDGIFLVNAGDVLFTDCTVSDHCRCVVSREGGLGTLERCTITESTGDSAVCAIQEGNLLLDTCTIHTCRESGLRVSSRGRLEVVRCSVSKCKAAVEALSDAAVIASDCEFKACEVGVLFGGPTGDVELRDTGGVQQYQPRSGVNKCRRQRSSVSQVSANASVQQHALSRPTPVLSPAAVPDAAGPFTLDARSPTLTELSLGGGSTPTDLDIAHERKNSSVTLPTPLDDTCTIDSIKSRIEKCSISDAAVGILCSPHGSGDVIDTAVEFGVVGVRMQDASSVTLSGLSCKKMSEQGIIVDGTPAGGSVHKSSFALCASAGAHLKKVGGAFLMSECIFDHNQGGVVCFGSSCRLDGCRIVNHDTFGTWHCMGDATVLQNCVLDSNKENGAVVLGASQPTLLQCLLRSSEHGVSTLQSSAVLVDGCTFSLNRIGLALYTEAASFDQPIADTEWNERYRSGGMRRRSSVGVILVQLQETLLASEQQASALAQTAVPLSTTRRKSRRDRGSVVAASLSETASPTTARRSDSVVTLSSPQKSNSAADQAPRVEEHKQSKIINSVFDQNSVGVDHGSSFVDVSIQSCKFTSCLTNACVVSAHAVLSLSTSHILGSTSGVLLKLDAKATIDECTFKSNRVGVQVEGNSTSQILRCTFHENAQSGVAITDRVVMLSVSHNKFFKNGRYGGVQISGRSLVQVNQNEFDEESIGIKVQDQSSPHLTGNAFSKCVVGIDVNGQRCNPRICASVFRDNSVGVSLDDKCSPDIYHNVFQRNTKYGLEIRHFADPTVVQNVFEHHSEKEASGVYVDSNGAGVLGNNKFVSNLRGLRVGCNSDTFVAMLNGFEKNSHAAVEFTEAAAGFFSRNQCSQNVVFDVLVSGGPSHTGLVIERNAFVVSGTGVCVDGAAVHPATIRQNRFYGSTGVGISFGVDSCAVASENLLNSLSTGIRFAPGGVGSVDVALVSGCQVGIHAAAASVGTVREATVVANLGSALVTDEGSKLSVTASRLGQTFGQKPHVLLCGAGEISNSLIYASHTVLVACAAASTATVQRCTIQQGKCGVWFQQGTNAVVRGNCISRNDMGVNIFSGASGVLNANSIFANPKCALQIATPHTVQIAKNFLSQETDAPSVLGIDGSDLAAIVKANNAVGHGGKPEGGEKLIVPVTVSKAVAAESTLLSQFHAYLSALGVPPTDALSALSSDGPTSTPNDGSGLGGTSGRGEGNNFSFASLLGSVSGKETHAIVTQAEERIYDLTARIAEGSQKEQDISRPAVSKRLQQLNWDVAKPLVRRRDAQPTVFEQFSNYGGFDSDEDDDDVSDSGSDDVGSIVYTDGSDSDYDYERMPDGSKRRRRRRRTGGATGRTAREGGRRRAGNAHQRSSRTKTKKGQKSSGSNGSTEEMSIEKRREAGDAEIASLLSAMREKEEQELVARKEQELQEATAAAVVSDEEHTEHFSSGSSSSTPRSNESVSADDADDTTEGLVGAPSSAALAKASPSSVKPRRVVGVTTPTSPTMVNRKQSSARLPALHRQKSGQLGRKGSSITASSFRRQPSLARMSSAVRLPSFRQKAPSSASAASASRSGEATADSALEDVESSKHGLNDVAPQDDGSSALLQPQQPSETFLAAALDRRVSAARETLSHYDAVVVVVKKKRGGAITAAKKKSPAVQLAPAASSTQQKTDISSSAAPKWAEIGSGRKNLTEVLDSTAGSPSSKSSAISSPRFCVATQNMDEPCVAAAPFRGERDAAGAAALRSAIDAVVDDTRLPLVLHTDDEGNVIPDEQVAAAMLDGEVQGLLLLSKNNTGGGADGARHGESEDDLVVSWPFQPNGGVRMLPSDPLDDVRALVLRRLQVDALRAGDLRLQSAMESFFSAIVSRGSRLVFVPLLTTAANRRRDSSVTGSNQLSVVGEGAAAFRDEADDAEESTSRRKRLLPDGSVAAAQVRSLARQQRPQWVSMVQRCRESIISLVTERNVKACGAGPPYLTAVAPSLFVPPMLHADAAKRPIDIPSVAERRRHRSAGGGSSCTSADQRTRRVLCHSHDATPIPVSTPLPLLLRDEDDDVTLPLPLRLAGMHTQRVSGTAMSVSLVDPLTASLPTRASRSMIMPSPVKPSTSSPAVVKHLKLVRHTPQLLLASARAPPSPSAPTLPHDSRRPSTQQGDRPPPVPATTGSAHQRTSVDVRTSCLLPVPPPRRHQHTPVQKSLVMVFDAARPRETSPYFLRVIPLLDPLSIHHVDETQCMSTPSHVAPAEPQNSGK